MKKIVSYVIGGIFFLAILFLLGMIIYKAFFAKPGSNPLPDATSTSGYIAGLFLMIAGVSVTAAIVIWILHSIFS